MSHSSDSKEVEEHTAVQPPFLLILVFYLLTLTTVQGVKLNGVHDLAQIVDIEKVIHVNDAHATAAIEAGDLGPWSKEAFFLYWCAFVASVCACASGYVSHVSLI